LCAWPVFGGILCAWSVFGGIGRIRVNIPKLHGKGSFTLINVDYTKMIQLTAWQKNRLNEIRKQNSDIMPSNIDIMPSNIAARVFIYALCFHLDSDHFCAWIQPSAFSHEEAKSCALPAYYTASTGNSLPTFRDTASAPFSRVKKVVILKSWFLKMETTGCPETSARNYQYSLCNMPGERSSQIMFIASSNKEPGCVICVYIALNQVRLTTEAKPLCKGGFPFLMRRRYPWWEFQRSVGYGPGCS
jgi:hypothetical protein